MCMGLIYMVFVWALYRNYVRFVWIVYRICSRRDLYVICMNFILHFAFDCWTIPFWIPDVGYLTKRNTHKTAELQQYLVITSANTIIVCQKNVLATIILGLGVVAASGLDISATTRFGMFNSGWWFWTPNNGMVAGPMTVAPDCLFPNYPLVI